MIDSLVWMINTRGRPIKVESREVKELEGRGFKSILGDPKQAYYPQYDGTQATRTTETLEIDGLTEVLDVEAL